MQLVGREIEADCRLGTVRSGATMGDADQTLSLVVAKMGAETIPTRCTVKSAVSTIPIGFWILGMIFFFNSTFMRNLLGLFSFLSSCESL